MKSKAKSKLPVYLFAGLVVVNSLIFSLEVIDPTLMVRLSFLGLFTTGFAVFSFFYFRGSTITIDLLTGVLLGFGIFSIISLIWTLNLSLGIIDVSKIILLLFFLILFNLLIDKYEIEFITTFIQFITVLFFISIIPFVYNAFDLNNFYRESMYSVFTISGHKNLYSSLLFLISIFSFLGLLYFKGTWKYIMITSLFFQITLVILLQTRAVYIGYGVLMIVGFLLLAIHKFSTSPKTISVVYLIIISLIGLNLFFIILFPMVISVYIQNLPVQHNTDALTGLSTITERILLWEKTYLVIKENWFFGVGGGNWRIFYASFSLPGIYKATDLNTLFQRPHNDFLKILSEYGLIGFNVFYLFSVLVTSFLYKIFIQNYHLKFIVLIAGIIGYLTISFFSFPIERIEHNLLLFSLFGIALFFIKKHIPVITEKKLLVKSSVLIAISMVSLLAFTFSFLNMKGEYFTQKIHTEKALKNYAKVVALCENAESFSYNLDPTSMPISWYKGNAQIKLNQLDKALASFKIAYSQNPYNQFVLNDLASGYYAMNYLDSAIYFYIESARTNPRFDDPKLNLAAIYINEGDFDSAKKWNDSILHDSERRDYYYQIISESNN